MTEHTKEAVLLSEHDRLQIDQAARGCISGTLEEWPDLNNALRLCGYYRDPETCAIDLGELCRKIVAEWSTPPQPVAAAGILSALEKSDAAIAEISKARRVDPSTLNIPFDAALRVPPAAKPHVAAAGELPTLDDIEKSLADAIVAIDPHYEAEARALAEQLVARGYGKAAAELAAVRGELEKRDQQWIEAIHPGNLHTILGQTYCTPEKYSEFAHAKRCNEQEAIAFNGKVVDAMYAIAEAVNGDRDSWIGDDDECDGLPKLVESVKQLAAARETITTLERQKQVLCNEMELLVKAGREAGETIAQVAKALECKPDDVALIATATKGSAKISSKEMRDVREVVGCKDEMHDELLKRLRETHEEQRERIRKIKTATCQGCLAAAIGEPLHTVAESGYNARSYCGDAWEAGWEFINGSATFQSHKATALAQLRELEGEVARLRENSLTAVSENPGTVSLPAFPKST